MVHHRPLPLATFLTLAGFVAAAPAEPLRDRFGDPLPEGAVARLGTLRLRQEQPVATAAFSPDGKTLVTAGFDRSIRFWDSATGKEERHWPTSSPSGTGALRYSSDGKTLILGGRDGVVRFLDAATGAEQRTLNMPNRGTIVTLDATRDGKTLLTADHAGNMTLWDVADGSPRHSFRGPGFVSASGQTLAALTPNGKHAVLPHPDATLHVVEVASGREVRAVEMPSLDSRVAAIQRIQRLAVSPDGQYLAFGNWRGTITVCSLATGKRLQEIKHFHGGIEALAFTPNSRFLAVANYGGVTIHGVLSGKELRHSPANLTGCTALVFSPDGKKLAATGTSCMVHLWDVAAGQPLHAADGHTSQIQALAFFPDGKRLASAGNDLQIHVWDTASGRPLERWPGMRAFPNSLNVCDDGKTLQLLDNGGAIHWWEPGDGCEPRRQNWDYRRGYVAALSPDGRTVALNASTPNRILQLQDVEGAKPPRPLATPSRGYTQMLRFSPDGRLLAGAGSDGVLRLWDRASGTLVRELGNKDQPRGLAWPLAFFEDGRSLAVFETELTIREVATGERRLRLPMTVPLSVLAVSPRGCFLAQGSHEGMIVVYGTGTGKEVVRLRGQQGPIRALAFSRDGRLLASGGVNGTILVWKLPEGEGLPATLKAEEADSLWQALGDADAARANRALAGLTAAPAQAVPLIKERFRVRGKRPSPERLARLVVELDDDSFKVREQATRELAEAGLDAAGVLRTALANSSSAEMKRRVEGLLDRLSKGGDPERLRCLRALEVLERIGTSTAKDLLRELSRKGLSADLAEEVRASLERLGDDRRGATP
jgi:WD40 repeat protein